MIAPLDLFSFGKNLLRIGRARFFGHASGAKEPEPQRALAPTLLLKVAGTGFQQIVERNESNEFFCGVLDDRHAREAFFRHAIDHNAQRFVGVGGNRFRANELTESPLQNRVSLLLYAFTNISTREHTDEASLFIYDG